MTQQALDQFRDQILDATQSKSLIRITGSGSKDWLGGNLKGNPMSTKDYSGILSYQPDELVITVKAGTSLKEVEQTLAEKNQQFPFEPPHFGDHATIGGMVCSGLAGPGRVSVGGLRDFVLGAKIMDGQGQVLSFGGTVMKNVAGYDVSRLLPGSLGTLALLLEVSIKVLPKTAAQATLCVQMNQAEAITLSNTLASQPWPINASAWIGEQLGTLYLRLSGAKAAVTSAIESFSKNYGMTLADEENAKSFWKSLREQTNEWFSHNPEVALWRFALPSTSKPLNLSGSTIVEWHGGQRWWKGNLSPQEVKALAHSLGGYASVHRFNNKSDDMLSSLKDNPLTIGLIPAQERLRKAFDPHGVFATGRLI
jgi:glycolate oxidase FAD binding subunit